MSAEQALPEQSLIGSRMLTLREQRVMLDTDLAQLHGVETRVVVQAVKRNLTRFPSDFMFQLPAAEFSSLRSQSVMSNPEGRGGRRVAPDAFTGQGVPMLSSVLGSQRGPAFRRQAPRSPYSPRRRRRTSSSG
jgi:hypothetical protein